LVTSVKWKHVSAFQVVSHLRETKFGFRISGSGRTEDFYVKLEEELEIWLRHLSLISISSGVHDDYALHEQIGSGTFSIVHRATDLNTGKKRAIKKISKTGYMDNPCGLECVKEEIEIMRSLNHPNLVKLYEVYEEESAIYIVMEYIEGRTLLELVCNDGKLCREIAAEITKQLLEAITHLNENSIIHRDIKLENVIIGPENHIKLIDFGLATLSKDLTSTKFCGSTGYIAPEVFTG
jgi:serine/threonine protein kinase